MTYQDKFQKNGFYYEISISEGKLFFSEWEDNRWGRNNGTFCDLKEFHEKSSEDALRVKALMQSLVGDEKVKEVVEVVRKCFAT